MQVIADWYGQGERRVELATGCAVWSHPGRAIVPLRWLIVRDPAGRFRPQAFLSTDPNVDPADMLAWFIRRWSIEVTFAKIIKAGHLKVVEVKSSVGICAATLTRLEYDQAYAMRRDFVLAIVENFDPASPADIQWVEDPARLQLTKRQVVEFALPRSVWRKHTGPMP